MYSIIFVAGKLRLASSFVIRLSKVFLVGVKKFQSCSRAKAKFRRNSVTAVGSFGFLVRGKKKIKEFSLRTQNSSSESHSIKTNVR
jgi:hypothetical protein